MAHPSLPRTLMALPKPAWVLLAGTFVNKFGNFVGVFLVLYLTTTGYTPGQAGLALGMVGLGNFVGALLGGAVTDHYGRRGVITVSMGGSAAFTLAVPFVSSLAAVIALVGLIGIFAQLYRPAAAALLLDVVPESQQVTAFAAYRFANNLGMALGPVIAGLLSSRSFIPLFAGDAATSLVFGLIAVAFLPETMPAAHADAEPTGGGYRAVARDRPFILFLLAVVAAYVVAVQAKATLPLHLRDRGLPNTLFGLLLSLNALIVVLLELPLTTYTQRQPLRAVIAGGFALLGVGFALTGLAHTAVALAGTVLIWTVAEMLYAPAASASPGRFAPSRLRGRYQGAYGGAQMLAAAVGPPLGASLYALNATILWGACGGVGLLAAALALAAKPQPERRANPESDGEAEPRMA